MSSRPQAAVLRRVNELFLHGSVAGLSDWQLLDRYGSRRDESAFDALVARHGPMVLGVCRRVLGDDAAADDAFQATFLVLVRRARSLREGDALGRWLYGVACRVALRARCEAARRRGREVGVGGAEGVAGVVGHGPDGDLSRVLDEELARLSESERAPVVLCYLEGLTHEEAALRLRWPVGTVKGRLSRAKERLRGRLTRRGVAPTSVALTAVLAGEARAVVPEGLRRAAVRSALWGLAGRTTTVAVPASVLRLSGGVLTAMLVTKLKTAAVVVGASGCLLLGAWAVAQTSRGGKPAAGRDRAAAPDGAKPAADAPANDRALRAALEMPIPFNFPNETPLADVLKYVKAATRGPNGPGVPIYVDPEGLKEAGATMQSTVAVDVKGVPLKAALDQALRPLKLGATTRDGLLVVTSRPEVTLIEVRRLEDELRRRAARPEPKPSVRAPETFPVGAIDESPAEWLKRLPVHAVTFSPDLEDEASPEDDAKTRAILDALKKTVPMAFPNETPLEDVLKYIREQTKGGDLRNGIPIYVDPIGLQEAEKTLSSTVTLDVQGVPLRESLRLILKQLGLTYSVKGGLLAITSESAEDTPPSPILQLAEKAERGHLSLGEMKELVEMFKVREEVMRYSSGQALPAESAHASPGRAAGAAPAPSDGSAGTAAIRAALEKVVPLHFDKASLPTVIKAVRKATAGPGLPEGIPIYLSPHSTGDAGWVTIDLDNVKLKTGLRLLLEQQGRTYSVDENLLIIEAPKP